LKELYQSGRWYFVTICTQGKQCIFVEEGSCLPNPDYPYPKFKLNKFGKIIENKIQNLPNYYNLLIDEYTIMPNHIHLIIGNNDQSISKIISGFKSFCYKEIKKVTEASTLDGDQEVSPTNTISEEKTNNSDESIAATKCLIKKHNTIWQKSFYDHIIRNETDLQRIREYIICNPLNWHLDSLNPSSPQN
jgi:putative transposase